ncbi:hypothetical protein OPS25_02990 [Alteromonas ponticola]|uniref:Uncharacterized protein n=1 Tax=Alteromonas aquimaris TaxID=2998417 RepID=A0ABT3P3W9_9ALTE|nr:hypothetical protein [Alteromonas aquimaris]MCW8107468.1 hypothetical protein [Alteromonas aquimaris]
MRGVNYRTLEQVNKPSLEAFIANDLQKTLVSEWHNAIMRQQSKHIYPCQSGGIGRRSGFKIERV